MNPTTGLVSDSHPPTSHAAARSVPDLTGKRLGVLRYIAASGGATDEMVIDATGYSPNTARPRRVELVGMGLVRDSGRLKKTRAGMEAVVWEATDEGRAAMGGAK